LYDKEKINQLFKRYVDTGSNKVFGQLIESCDPLIDVVLKRFKKHSRHLSDLKQEVRLKLLQYQRSPDRLRRYLTSPTTYLFFIIRAYTRLAFEQMRQQFGEDYEITFSSYSKTLLSLIQDDLLDPEILYIVRKEIPRELFANCKERFS